MNHDHSNGMSKHMLLMLICCLVPIGLILAVSTLGISLGPLQPFLPYVIALMCPLMMIGMMGNMMRGHGEDHSQHHVDAPSTQPAKQIPETVTGTVKTAAVVGQEKCH